MGGLLIVDDSLVIQAQLKVLIERAHLAGDVREASSATGARALIRAEAPRVVFLDLTLPDGSGADLVRAIVARDPRTLVILVTAQAPESAEVVGALGLGACAYLRKPLRFADFDAVCRDLGLPRKRAGPVSGADPSGDLRRLSPP